MGEPGEILVRGPQVVMAYLDNEKATRETFNANGWPHIGDQGATDEEGEVRIKLQICSINLSSSFSVHNSLNI